MCVNYKVSRVLRDEDDSVSLNIKYKESMEVFDILFRD